MNVRDVHRRLGKAAAQLVLPRFQFAQASQQGATAAAVLNERDDLLYGSYDLVQFAPVGVAAGPALVVEPVGLLRIGTHGLGGDLRRHEPRG